jgi:hypothetical protein
MATMKYTYQRLADSGNWAHPEPTDVRHASSLDWLRDSLEGWADTVGRYDDPQAASLMVWCGDLEDVTDQYPDFMLTVGPRGGIRREPC